MGNLDIRNLDRRSIRGEGVRNVLYVSFIRGEFLSQILKARGEGKLTFFRFFGNRFLRKVILYRVDYHCNHSDSIRLIFHCRFVGENVQAVGFD